MKTYGGTYADYLDTPESIIEMMLRVDDAYTEAARPAPLGTMGGSVPMIS
jgi:hypothetical protein